jgi:hypothetical protein
VSNRATFVFNKDGAVVLQDTLTIWDQSSGVPAVYQITEDGKCKQTNPVLPPDCGEWVKIQPDIYRQICVSQSGGNVANMTTTVNLDNNHLVTLKYTVSSQGQTVASLAISRQSSKTTPPSPSKFVPPASCTDSNSPFDPKSCSGAVLNLASKFTPGAKATQLANYTLAYEQRPCTQFTNCGPWVKATPSYGPSGQGTIWLKVTATGIIAALVDKSAGSQYGTPIYNLGADCTYKTNWDCGSYHDTEIVEGGNTLKFGGTDKFSGVTPQISGSLLSTCGQFGGSIKGPTSGGTWTEYRVGLLVHY